MVIEGGMLEVGVEVLVVAMLSAEVELVVVDVSSAPLPWFWLL